MTNFFKKIRLNHKFHTEACLTQHWGNNLSKWKDESGKRKAVILKLIILDIRAILSDNAPVHELAKKADVSPTVIQKLRSKDSQKVTLTTFTSVLRCQGYQIKLEKVPSIR